MTTLDILRARWDESTQQLTALRDRAVNENRELTEAEQANQTLLREQVTRLEAQISDAVELDASVNRTRDLLASLPQPTGSLPVRATSGQLPTVRREGRTDREAVLRETWPTPGDYMHDIIEGYKGDTAARERIQRAIADEVTGDVPGLVPEPIVGELINIIDASRPIVAALRSYPMPQYGSSFTRPKVKQHTEVGVQATQKTQLPSRKFLVDPIQVSKVTYGGAIDVAFQVIDWTNPSALNAISDDLADQYAIQTEDAAAAKIEAAALANVANAVTLTADNPVAGMYTAAAKVYAGCKRLPDTWFASVDMWAWLGGLVDKAGRPLFPMLGPANAPGTQGGVTTFAGNPLGARLVVSPALADGTLILGASRFAEVYEDRRGALRVVEPKLLGWEIAYYGYFAGVVTEDAAFVTVKKPTP